MDLAYTVCTETLYPHVSTILIKNAGLSMFISG